MAAPLPGGTKDWFGVRSCENQAEAGSCHLMYQQHYTSAELSQLSKALLRLHKASLRTLLTPVEGKEAFGGRYHEALKRDPEACWRTQRPRTSSESDRRNGGCHASAISRSRRLLCERLGAITGLLS